MAINPSKCHRYNVADTCSIWNLLSSKKLYYTAREVGFSFCTTYFVLYEALHKRRGNEKEEANELRKLFLDERRAGQFKDYHLEIEDLQSLEALECRMALGKGELSAMLFAQKTRQAFLTDDQKARALAQTIVQTEFIQTTPHILSHLYFQGHLVDGDIVIISDEHTKNGQILAKWFYKAYELAMQARCMMVSNLATNQNSPEAPDSSSCESKD